MIIDAIVLAADGSVDEPATRELRGSLQAGGSPPPALSADPVLELIAPGERPWQSGGDSVT